MYYHQHVHSRSISCVRTRYKDCLKAQDEHKRHSGLLAAQSSAVWEDFCADIWSARTHLKRTHTHTHIWSARTHTHTSEAHAHTHTHLKRTCARTHIWSVRTQTVASTVSPPLFWAWMNKYRQNYINIHVLANILVNSWLSITYVLM